jgi:hypothetical protein
VVTSLVADAIDEIQLSSGPARLIDVCTVPLSDGNGDDWQPVPNFPQPMCLPVFHPDYPCNPGTANEQASRDLALPRISYGSLDHWTSGNNFSEFHQTLVEIVSGGPSNKAVTDHVELVTADPAPSNPAAPPPTTQVSSLDLLLTASVHPAVAQMLGLYWVDDTAVEGQRYDYLLVADYTNAAGGSLSTVQSLVLAQDYSNLDGYVRRGVVRAVTPPLATPDGVDAYALPLGNIPTTSRGDVAGLVGLRWNVPVHSGAKIPPEGAILFQLWRAELGRVSDVTTDVPPQAHAPRRGTPTGVMGTLPIS